MRSLLALAIVLVAGLAHADDSSFPKIDVKGINPGPMSAGESMTFYGKNADDFFKMLPHSMSVDPKFDKADAKVNRFLAIKSTNNTVTLECSKVIQDSQGNQTLNPKGTECKITFVGKSQDEGDSFDFKPVDAVTKK